MERRLHLFQARRRRRRTKTGGAISEIVRTACGSGQLTYGFLNASGAWINRPLPQAVADLLFDLYSRPRADIVLALAVKERRQVIDLNRAHVQVFSRVHIQASTEGHRKRSIALHSRRQCIVKARAHVRDAEQSMNKRRHAPGSPVITRSRHHVVALHPRVERPARSPVEIAGSVVSARETGHDSDVARHVLIEFGGETVVVNLLGSKVNGPAIEGRGAVLIEPIGIVIRSLVSVSDIEFIEGIIVATVLSKR